MTFCRRFRSLLVGFGSASICLLLTNQLVNAQENTTADPAKRQVFFGEQHMHSEWSSDAFTLGVRQSAEDAYRWAMGEEITLSTTGEKMKKSTPYDFVALTDHAEYLGVFPQLIDPKNPLSKSEFAKSLLDPNASPSDPKSAINQVLASFKTSTPIEAYVTAKLQTSNWKRHVAIANQFNKPGKFTTLLAFEWTSIPNSQNMHRNVFFRDDIGPEAPFSAFDSIYPEDLWTYLEVQRNSGHDCFAIPHNGNVSNGLMYAPTTMRGEAIDQRYAQRRQRNEPLTEMIQTKGASETHPLLSPSDEFADFEMFPNMINSPTPSKVHYGYIRQALTDGLLHEQKLGTNPFKFGIVSGADVHSGYSGNEEFNWHGAHGGLDDTPKKRLDPKPNASGEQGYIVGSAGATAVWADENTREGIFDAMKRKETYGTSGPLIRLRLFAGWDYPDTLADDREFAKKGYAGGVPMGSDLPQKPKTAKSPNIAIQALKDPESGNLDRVQVIKGWVDQGITREKIYDVAWSGDRKHDAGGKLPAVGNTVDLKTAKYTNDIGASQLKVVWTDPDFDPSVPAVYYVRVLEIPTPRWTTYDSVKLGVAPPEEVPATIQERAWSSPIWYTPPVKK